MIAWEKLNANETRLLEAGPWNARRERRLRYWQRQSRRRWEKGWPRVPLVVRMSFAISVLSLLCDELGVLDWLVKPLPQTTESSPFV